MVEPPNWLQMLNVRQLANGTIRNQLFHFLSDWSVSQNVTNTQLYTSLLDMSMYRNAILLCHSHWLFQQNMIAPLGELHCTFLVVLVLQGNHHSMLRIHDICLLVNLRHLLQHISPIGKVSFQRLRKFLLHTISNRSPWLANANDGTFLRILHCEMSIVGSSVTASHNGEIQRALLRRSNCLCKFERVSDWSRCWEFHCVSDEMNESRQMS
mmetsp:Transcript_6913/g.25796  ORF Transcript_6913/g.25796 Transcript_6913/m.25796 type:complete len:211 (+) Transcript_6913:2880-3512(+)